MKEEEIIKMNIEFYELRIKELIESLRKHRKILKELKLKSQKYECSYV